MRYSLVVLWCCIYVCCMLNSKYSILNTISTAEFDLNGCWRSFVIVQTCRIACTSASCWADWCRKLWGGRCAAGVFRRRQQTTTTTTTTTDAGVRLAIAAAAALDVEDQGDEHATSPPQPPIPPRTRQSAAHRIVFKSYSSPLCHRPV